MRGTRRADALPLATGVYGSAFNFQVSFTVWQCRNENSPKNVLGETQELPAFYSCGVTFAIAEPAAF